MTAYLLAVVCEAPADQRAAAHLADRVLSDGVAWIDPESIDLHRQWQGLEEGSGHLKWREVRTLARRRKVKIHGHFHEEAGFSDAKVARLALELFRNAERIPDAVILIRDSDGHTERRTGLEQARAEKPWPFPIAIGLAHLNRECWVLAGFEPKNEAERERLAGLQEELGFDPRHRSGSLRGKPGELRHAKLVLGRLVGNDPEREEACWTACDLERLRERGAATGLAEYLDEVRERIVPIFGAPVP